MRAIVAALVAGILITLYKTTVVMLVLGACHSVDDRVPAFGWWTVFFVVWAVEVATRHASIGDS